MAGLIGKAHDLVFNRRAVARSHAGRPAAIDRRFRQALSNDLVGLLIGEGDAASNLRGRDLVCQEREGHGRIISLLHVQLIPMDGRAIEPGRRAGLEAAHA